MTPFDLVLARHPSGLVKTGVTSQERDTLAEESMGTWLHKPGTLRHLSNALIHLLSKLGSAQRLYTSDYDHKVSFCPVIKAGSFEYVERPSRALTEAKRQDLEPVDGANTDASCKLLPKSKRAYCVR